MVNKTGSFGIAVKGMIVKGDKVLIIYKSAQEAKNDPNPNLRRDLPGGRVEFGESADAALKREILEEVNLEVEIISPIHVWHYVKNGFQLIGINFACIWKNGEVELSGEHESYEWLTLANLVERNWDDIDSYRKLFKLEKDGGFCD